VHVRRYPLSSLPGSDAELAGWLRERFVEKDRLLDGFFRNGHFPASRGSQAVELGAKDQPALFPYVPFTGAIPEA